MNEIYLVTQGSYSDYSVRGVFADQKLATEYAAQISTDRDAARVDTRKIMTESDFTVPIGYRGYKITMDVDGNTYEVKPIEIDGDSYPETKFVRTKFVSNNTNSSGEYIYTGRYKFSINTDKGPEGAIKIANERRVRMIAENAWPKEGLIDQWS
jgi:hypothetical protein